jgi:hypothetical protein
MQELSSRLLVENPDEIAKRLLLKAHTRDGLPEMFVGLLFVLAAPLNWMSSNLDRSSMGFKGSFVAGYVGWLLLAVSIPWLIKWARRRFLVEQEGYVQLKSSKRMVIRILLVAAVVCMLLGAAALWLKPPGLDRWILAALGLFVCAVWSLIGQTLRFRVVGALNGATGILLAFNGLSIEISLAIFFGVSGLASLLSGLVVFIRFMRKPIRPGE